MTKDHIMPVRQAITTVLCLILLASRLPAADVLATPKLADREKMLVTARDLGLDWLTKHQAADGSWGQTYRAGWAEHRG